MSVPNLYKNIGKQANDLLTKDFEKNLPSVKVETKAENEVTFTIQGRRDPKTLEFIIDPFQYKYDLVDKGLSFIAKANSNRKLTGELTVTDKFAKGLKFVAGASTSLTTKPDQNPDNETKIGLEYTRDNLAATVDYEFFKRMASTSVVVGHKGINLGGDLEFNLVDGVPTKYSTAASYTAGNFVVTGSLRDKFHTFGSSFFRKVNDNVSVGGEFLYKLQSSDTTFNAGGSYKLDKDTIVKGKISNKGIVSLSYIQNLRKNVRAVFSTEVDAFNLSKPDGHKVGFGITLTDE